MSSTDILLSFSCGEHDDILPSVVVMALTSLSRPAATVTMSPVSRLMVNMCEGLCGISERMRYWTIPFAVVSSSASLAVTRMTWVPAGGIVSVNQIINTPLHTDASPILSPIRSFCTHAHNTHTDASLHSATVTHTHA